MGDRPGRAERHAAQQRIRDAAADGRLVAEDAALRMAQLRDARSHDEIDLVVRDLDQRTPDPTWRTYRPGPGTPEPRSTPTVREEPAPTFEPYRPHQPAAPASPPGSRLTASSRLASTSQRPLQMARPAKGSWWRPYRRNGRLRLPVRLQLGLVAAALVFGGGADILQAVTEGGSDDASSRGAFEAAPEVPDFLTPRGVRQLRRAMQRELGTTRANEFSLGDGLALVIVPPSGGRRDNQVYGWGDERGLRRAGRARDTRYGLVDLRDLEPEALAAALQQAVDRTGVDDPLDLDVDVVGPVGRKPPTIRVTDYATSNKAVVIVDLQGRPLP